MNICFFSVEEVNKKIHNLRTYFLKEVKQEEKVRSGAGAHEKYVSKWAYFKSLQFLRPSTEKRQTLSSLSDSSMVSFQMLLILCIYQCHRNHGIILLNYNDNFTDIAGRTIAGHHVFRVFRWHIAGHWSVGHRKSKRLPSRWGTNFDRCSMFYARMLIKLFVIILFC